MNPFALTTFLGISFLLLVSNAKAQTKPAISCGDAQVTELLRNTVARYDKQVERKEVVISEYARQMYRGTSGPGAGRNTVTVPDSGYIVPVVVHVVYPSGEAYGSGTNISYAQIRSQIEALNAAFGKNYPAYNGQSHPAYAQKAKIKFCLARIASNNSPWATGPGGTEFGVKRYADNSGAYNHDITMASANQLLAITHPDPFTFPFTKYLNIWIVKTIGGGNNIMGYAPRPIVPGYPLDGIVMRADIFGDNTTGGNFLSNNFGLLQGKVLAHEAGHYFNLYHIFQGGCAGANAPGAATDACDLNGDMICDIEPCITQNIFCSTPIPNTCTASYNTGTTSLDMINSYMSYADDDCMNTFTADQAKRMWATIDLYRAALVHPENLLATGVLGNGGCVPPYLNAQIITDGGLFCAGKPVTFSNPAGGNTATSRLWQLPGASITTSTNNPVTVTYSTPGNYKVILQVSDGTTTRKDSLLFTVLECRLDSGKLFMSHWYFDRYGCLDFTAGAPVQKNTALVNNTMQNEIAYPTQLDFYGGSVSLSDSLGNLLFYSNRVSVWNKNHQKISSGPIFGASDITASGNFCFSPFPGQPQKYILAGAYPNFDNAPSGVRFAVVDLAANTVLPYQQMQHPSLPARFSQYTTVVPHCNGTDYWLIVKGFDEDTRFYSFLITGSGLSATQAPVISAGFLQKGFGGSGYQLKASRFGNKLALASPSTTGSICALYDFDAGTGQVKNEKLVPTPSQYSNIQGGVGFSPNGEFFYLFRSSNFATNGLPYWLFQYRVSDLQYNVLSAPGFYFASPLQTGPDNQIYVTTQDHYVAKINNPDVWNGVTFTGFLINMRQLSDSVRPNISIPNFIEARRPLPTNPDFTSRLITCNTYRFSALCYDNYTATWNFGDGSAPQTGATVTHTYAQSGSYMVTLTLSQGATVFGSTSKPVTIAATNNSIQGPGNVCVTGVFPTQYSAAVIPGAEFRWTVTSGRIAGPDNLPFVSIAWNSAATTGTVFLEMRKDSCIWQLSKAVTLQKGPQFSWMLKESACVADSAIILTASPAGGQFAGPAVSNNRFRPAVAGIGSHTLTYTYADEQVCAGQIQKTITVKPCDFTNTAVCEELLNSLVLQPNPVNSLLQLKGTLDAGYIKIFNTLGQRVAEGPLVNNRFTLPVLAPGIYIAQVFCDRNTGSKTFKFTRL
jgi:PKD repeat protein